MGCLGPLGSRFPPKKIEKPLRGVCGKLIWVIIILDIFGYFDRSKVIRRNIFLNIPDMTAAAPKLKIMHSAVIAMRCLLYEIWGVITLGDRRPSIKGVL